MEKGTVLVVDDEKSAQNRLIQFLKEEPDFEIAGVAATGGDALRMVKDLAEMFRGADLAPTWLEIDVDGSVFLVVLGEEEWTHVHGPSEAEEYDRFSYRSSDRSWFFGERPTVDNYLSTVIDALLKDSDN